MQTKTDPPSMTAVARGNCRRPAPSSNPGVPFVAAILPEASAAAAQRSETFDRFDAHHIFGHFVAELTLDPEAQRGAMLDRQLGAVHVAGEDRLRMKGIDEIDALVISACSLQGLLGRVGPMQDDVAGGGP